MVSSHLLGWTEENHESSLMTSVWRPASQPDGLQVQVWIVTARACSMVTIVSAWSRRAVTIVTAWASRAVTVVTAWASRAAIIVTSCVIRAVAIVTAWTSCTMIIVTDCVPPYVRRWFVFRPWGGLNPLEKETLFVSAGGSYQEV